MFCPKCNVPAEIDSYFGGYVCPICKWRDNKSQFTITDGIQYPKPDRETLKMLKRYDLYIRKYFWI